MKAMELAPVTAMMPHDQHGRSPMTQDPLILSHGPDPDPDMILQERDLLRAQLLALTALLEADTPTDPQFHQSELTALADRRAVEINLLRDHLSYLQADLGLGGAVPPTTIQPTTSLTTIEAAIARLLADLVQETDRRILAEAEARSARAILRRLGVDTPPTRNAVAPRP